MTIDTNAGGPQHPEPSLRRDEAAAGDARSAPTGTGSRFTRLLGLALIIGGAAVAWLAFVATPPDVVQGESVRLLYVHVPSVSVAYMACMLTTVASAVWLRRRTEWWDLVASSSAEVGAVFTAVTLLSGMVWGQATWGTPWEWDARLTSTLFLFLLLLGYLGLRGATEDRTARGRRSAIVGLLLVPNVIVVNQSVNWWRSLHQDATLFRTDGDFRIEGLQLFTWVFATVVAIGFFVWLLVHRFRVGWLADRAEDRAIDEALAVRRAEGGTGGAP
ncbi:MAG: cytochrome c biogenesis protein CcsA [Acidimicrobiia bacterium]|nr:cytochrome c biogenesis protein CcsA [Acidimicrobiia bacterium]